jgi:hypothetical protein
MYVMKITLQLQVDQLLFAVVATSLRPRCPADEEIQ